MVLQATLECACELKDAQLLIKIMSSAWIPAPGCLLKN